MVRALGPGAQTRLQQSLHPSHTTPSTPPQRLGPEGGASQVPTLAPTAFVQVELQQSSLREQMSPGWMHQDTANSHFPLTHDFEQH
jgi:hypothetical protein